MQNQFVEMVSIIWRICILPQVPWASHNAQEQPSLLSFSKLIHAQGDRNDFGAAPEHG